MINATDQLQDFWTSTLTLRLKKKKKLITHKKNSKYFHGKLFCTTKDRDWSIMTWYSLFSHE